MSPTQQYTTVVPLGVVLAASAVKELQEDLKRHQSDRGLNARAAEVLDPRTRTFEEVRRRRSLLRLCRSPSPALARPRSPDASVR